ncbi:MAG: pyridoxal-phosphate dependent enzyme [Candidatus Lernaella stagnicola]|nr:pyridoxal-phosphate dependent enzyme [Candidatus Lernaella stagnicola]
MSESRDRRWLFRRFPALADRLPWQQLANLPTPVERCEKFSARLGAEVWIKRDDLDSDLYSGNKPRKFEFIFADAARCGAKQIMTMGSVGSNHAAATSLFCCRLGYQPVLAVVPQPVLSYVRENILVDHSCNPIYLLSRNEAEAAVKMMLHSRRVAHETGTPPYFMYFGGSSRIGNVGFVEAGLELAAQIKAGDMPEPSRIFVATGSCGTHAGLLVGLRAAGSNVRVIGVRIVPKIVTNKLVVATHANLVASYLRHIDSTFPAMHFSTRDIDLLDDFFGGEYGRPTAAGKEAIFLARDTDGIDLDPTYTGKAFAGLLAYLYSCPDRQAPILFWHTKNGLPLDRWTEGVAPESLPPMLQRYFTEPLYDPEL